MGYAHYCLMLAARCKVTGMDTRSLMFVLWRPPALLMFRLIGLEVVFLEVFDPDAAVHS